MQLQNAKEQFEKQGLKLAAISYDSPAILKDFADRHRIEFPLLADANSKVIRRFNLLNEEAKGMEKDMAHPGFFCIDAEGVIRERYFETKYTDRFTANNVIEKLFPELTVEAIRNGRGASCAADSWAIGSHRNLRQPGYLDCGNRAASRCTRVFLRAWRAVTSRFSSY